MAFLYRLDRFLPRRIEQADQAEEDEILRQICRTEGPGFDTRILEPREPEHTLALTGELVRDLRESLAVERCGLAVSGLLPVAILEDDLGRALDQQYLFAVGALVEGRHELVLRLERDGIDSGIRLLLGLPVHPELGRKRIKRPLGRVTFDLPNPFLLKEFGVVAEHRHAAQQPEHRLPLVRRLPVLLDLALGRVAVAGDLVLRFGGGSRDDHHLHQSQGAGLVRADPRHRAQGFYGREAPDNRVALRHTLDADRQGDRDQRGQAFRNQRHRDADDRLEQLHELHAHHPAAVGEHQNPHDADGGGDQVAEFLDLPQ